MPRWVYLFVVGISVLPDIASADEDAADHVPPLITVDLDDGRSVSGRIDPRTSGSDLKLTLMAGRIMTTTSVKWSKVAKVHIPQETLAPAELRERWRDFQLSPLTIKSFSDPAKNIVARKGKERLKRTAVRRPVSLDVDAWLVNWDADSEPDGIQLTIYPVDANGVFVATAGQIDASLIGLHRRLDGGRLKRPGRPDVSELEHWGRRIKAADFVNGAVTVRLPFRRIDPERQLDLFELAALHVRFGVSGQGVFEATIDELAIRRIGRFRDELQRSTGARQFTFERP